MFEAGGLQCSLTFIREFGNSVHKDTLHSAMNVVSRLCGRMEPQDTNLEACVKSLSTLLKHEDPYVSALPKNVCSLYSTRLMEINNCYRRKRDEDTV